MATPAPTYISNINIRSSRLTSRPVQVGSLIRRVGFQNAAGAVRKVRVAPVVVLQVQGRVEIALPAKARRVCEKQQKTRKKKTKGHVSREYDYCMHVQQHEVANGGHAGGRARFRS